MLTVPQAAKRVRRHPETVRRWIRSGRLRSRKVGTQWLVDEDDLADLASEPEELPGPPGLERTSWGDEMPNVVAWIHRSRAGH